MDILAKFLRLSKKHLHISHTLQPLGLNGAVVSCECFIFEIWGNNLFDRIVADSIDIQSLTRVAKAIDIDFTEKSKEQVTAELKSHFDGL